jgi:hypothetical protein
MRLAISHFYDMTYMYSFSFTTVVQRYSLTHLQIGGVNLLSMPLLPCIPTFGYRKTSRMVYGTGYYFVMRVKDPLLRHHSTMERCLAQKSQSIEACTVDAPTAPPAIWLPATLAGLEEQLGLHLVACGTLG